MSGFDFPCGFDYAGANLLDEVHAFVARFVVFGSGTALDASVLWIAHTHVVQRQRTSPRLLLDPLECGHGLLRV